jgi:hypothetical protein
VQQTDCEALDIRVECQFGPRQQANRSAHVLPVGEAARAGSKIARHQPITDLGRPRAHAMQAEVTHGETFPKLAQEPFANSTNQTVAKPVGSAARLKSRARFACGASAAIETSTFLAWPEPLARASRCAMLHAGYTDHGGTNRENASCQRVYCRLFCRRDQRQTASELRGRIGQGVMHVYQSVAEALQRLQTEGSLLHVHGQLPEKVVRPALLKTHVGLQAPHWGLLMVAPLDASYCFARLGNRYGSA